MNHAGSHEIVVHTIGYLNQKHCNVTCIHDMDSPPYEFICLICRHAVCIDHADTQRP